MTRRAGPGWSIAGGLVVLVAVVVAVGPSAAGRGLRAVDPVTVAAAVAIGGVGTALAAARWRAVSRRLGLGLTWRGAVGECYRSQLLDAVLPGGVVGDVGRGVRQGRAADDVARGLRAVAWERGAGQVVLALCALPALVGTAERLDLGAGAGRDGVVAAVLVVAGTSVAVRVGQGRGVVPQWGRAAVAVLRDDVRAVGSPGTLTGLAGLSLAVLATHVATLLLAARAVGVPTSPRLLGPVLLVLLAGGLPLNVAGWGPREGAAAWAFTTVGLTPATGLAVAVAYGALGLVATLPGLVVVAASAVRVRRAAIDEPAPDALTEEPARA